MQKFVFPFFLWVLMAQGACVSHDFPVCQENYSFDKEIRPIIEAKCAIAGCHNGDTGSTLNWNDFSQFHRHAESGKVKFRVANRSMPPRSSPGGPLSPEEIDAIVCWSDQGSRPN